MKTILAIARKEVQTALVTPLAYVIIAGFLVVAGFFFFTLLQQYNAILAQAALYPDVKPNLNEWVVIPFYQTLQIVLVFLLPIICMRSLAEEKQRGTFELLATSPLTMPQIVFGKFIGLCHVVFIMLGFSFVFPLLLIITLGPEWLPILIGFLGLCLFAFSFVALGVAVSSCTKSQAVSGVIGLVVFLLFYVINAPAARLEGKLAEILNYAAPTTHTELLLKGVITGSALVYFLSVISFGIFVSVRALEAERGR